MAGTASKSDTRAQLLGAAEELFATRGIEAVSLREINRAAGQANASALHYHFANRMGLLEAVLAKHRADSEPLRHSLLDQYEADGVADIRPLAAALVLPLAAKLSDSGGRYYLQINSEVYTRTSLWEQVTSDDSNNSVIRWHSVIDEVVPEHERSELHSRFPAIRFAFVELARRAAQPARADERLFTSHLVDLVAALLSATPSPDTTLLLDRRRRRRESG